MLLRWLLKPLCLLKGSLHATVEPSQLVRQLAHLVHELLLGLRVCSTSISRAHPPLALLDQLHSVGDVAGTSTRAAHARTA